MTYLQHPVDHNLYKLSHDSIRVVKDLYHLIMNLQQQQQQQRRKTGLPPAFHCLQHDRQRKVERGSEIEAMNTLQIESIQGKCFWWWQTTQLPSCTVFQHYRSCVLQKHTGLAVVRGGKWLKLTSEKWKHTRHPKCSQAEQCVSLTYRNTVVYVVVDDFWGALEVGEETDKEM